MENSLISIIVPVYNCEKYLNRCVNSLLNQTYENYEIILINDGSLDLSNEICTDYLKKSSKVKVICNEKNKGVSYTRNEGIKASKGNYIMFVDGDDEIPQNALQLLYDKIVDTNVDIVIGNYSRIYANNKVEDAKLIKKIDDNYIDFIAVNGLWGPCNRLIKRDRIIKGFDEDIYVGEDALFWGENIEECSYEYISDIVYNYYMNDDSIMHSKNVNETNITFFEGFEKLINIIEKKAQIGSICCMVHYIENVFKYNIELKDPNGIMKRYNKDCKNLMNCYFKKVRKSRHISFIKYVKLCIKVTIVNVFC